MTTISYDELRENLPEGSYHTKSILMQIIDKMEVENDYQVRRIQILDKELHNQKQRLEKLESIQ